MRRIFVSLGLLLLISTAPAAAQVGAQVGTLEVHVTYLGLPPSQTGAACNFNLTLNGFGFLGNLCDSQTTANIPAGEYSAQLGYAFGGPLLGPALIEIAAGQTTVYTFDVSSIVGVVNGRVQVNAQAPPSGYGVCGSTNGQACGGFTNGGDFSLLLPAGSGSGFVWGDGCQCIQKGTFGLSVAAGTTTDIGVVNILSGGDLDVRLAYQGAPPSSTGAVCNFNLNLIGYGFLGNLCDETVVHDIRPGNYSLQLGYANGGSLLDPVPVTITSAQTTNFTFDVSQLVGIVNGQVTVNHNAPPSGFGACGSTNGQACGSQNDGTFSLLLPAGHGSGFVWGNGCTCIRLGSFAFDVTAGQTSNVGVQDVELGALQVDITYKGAPPSASGAVCNFNLNLNGYGFLGNLCDSLSTSGIPAGQYTAQLGYAFGGTLLPPVLITITGGATTHQTFDVSALVGIVTGHATINGAQPGNGYGVCGTTNGQACEGFPSGNGSFMLMLPAGPGSGWVWGNGCTCIQLATFTFNVVAGSSTDVGDPSRPNNPPTANAQSLSTAADTSVDIVLTGSDPDGDALTFTISTPPAHGSLSGTAPSMTYAPAAAFTGTDTFQFTVTDPRGASSTATVIIQVVDATAPTVTITSPADASFTVGQQVTASFACGDSGSGVATCAGTVVSGAAIDTSSAGLKTFSVTATDAAGNATTKSVRYLVAPTTQFAAGHVWVADSPIREFAMDGSLVRTVNDASFQQACDLAFSPSQTFLYVTDCGGDVKLLGADGVVFGSFGRGSVQVPRGMAVRSTGEIYVADVAAGDVKVFSPGGALTRTIGDGLIPGGALNVALSPDETKLFVSESNYSTGVHQFDLANGDHYLGRFGTTASYVSLTSGLLVAADGTLYVGDSAFGSGSDTVKIFDAAGNFGGVLASGFSAPFDLALDASGNVWIANANDFQGDHVRAYSTTGLLLHAFGQDHMSQPTGIAISPGVPIQPTTLVAATASAVFGGNTTLSATLTATLGPVSGATIGFSLNGASVGNAVTNASGVATLTVSTAGIAAGAHANVVGATYAGDSGYASASASADLAISKAPVQMSLSTSDASYDGMPHAATATAHGINGELLGPIVIAYNGGSAAPVHAATYTVTATFAGNDSYLAGASQGSITIAPAALTVTANDAVREFGTANPAFSAVYGPFQGSDSPASLTGALAFATTADISSRPGTYPIVPSGVTSTDYIVQFVNGALTVRDTTPPALTVPSSFGIDATSANGAVVTFAASATDAVDGSTTVSCTPASGSLFPLGRTTVNCSSADAHGNTAHASFRVTVRDTKPVLTIPSALTTEAAGPGGTVVTFAASAMDAVDGPTAVSCAPASGSLFPLGRTVVICSSTDSQGNTAQDRFSITVRDTTPPVLTVPSPLTIEAASASGAIVTFAASATDVVDGSTLVDCAPASGSLFTLGTTNVTCSSADAHGNTARERFGITVPDTTPPTIGSVSASEPVLSAANHKMVAETIAVAASDTVDAAPTCRITDVSSNEPVDADGDWVVTGRLTLKVRADRLDSGAGRVYTVQVTCADRSGNTATSATTISVPHD
jgi:sugar lactone lactonase YvrE